MSAASEIVIRVRGLSKAYRLSGTRGRATTLAEAVSGRLKRLFRGSRDTDFWALRDVDVEVNRGEVVGIIGRNGAGKSTLLKILSRITQPTRGRVELYGRVGSLLEVGTGFHPELTGRENIYLNGAILGMSRSSITRQFDAIVDFADIEEFLDTPVKRYSSGMYVRLAFAVAAHLNPEILIVDEVLAVGDAAFQKKCLGKMREVSAEEGKTVLFVSHNLGAIASLCGSAMLMDRGRLVMKGETRIVIGKYCLAEEICSHALVPQRKHIRGNGAVRIDEVMITARDGAPRSEFGIWEAMKVCLGYCSDQSQRAASFWLLISRSDGQVVISGFQKDSGQLIPLKGARGGVEVIIDKNRLLPGEYLLSAGAFGPYGEFLDWAENVVSFRVVPTLHGVGAFDGRLGLLTDQWEWRACSFPGAEPLSWDENGKASQLATVD